MDRLTRALLASLLILAWIFIILSVLGLIERLTS